MKIKILRIIIKNIVEFSTEVGTGVGILSNNELKESKEYQGEIDIDQKIELGINTNIIFENNIFIRHNNFENEIQGAVENIDDDKMIYLRMTEDCLIMIENDNVKIKEKDYIRLTVNAEKFIITLIGE